MINLIQLTQTRVPQEHEAEMLRLRPRMLAAIQRECLGPARL